MPLLFDKGHRAEKICKKSVSFYCITTSLWRTVVNHLLLRLKFSRGGNFCDFRAFVFFAKITPKQK